MESESKMGETTPHPIINQEECKSCGRCIAACPKHVLRRAGKLNSKGVIPVEYIGEGCIGCGICFYNCPEPYALSVQKKSKQ